MKLEVLKPKQYTGKGQVTIKFSYKSAYISSKALNFLDLDEQSEILMATDKKSGTKYVGVVPEDYTEHGVKVNMSKHGGATIASAPFISQGVDEGKYFIEKRGIKEGGIVWYPLSYMDDEKEAEHASK